MHARDIVNLTEEQVWLLPDGAMHLTFDDTELRTTTRETIFSWYCWWPHREWPNTPLLCEHHMGNRRLTAETHLQLMDAGAWLAFDTHPGQIDPEYIGLRNKQWWQRLYNALTYRLEAYVTSISAWDAVEVLYSPEVQEINQRLSSIDARDPRNQGMVEPAIAKAAEEVAAVLRKPTYLPHNQMVGIVRSNVYSMGQIVQCVNARGQGQDIDQSVFPLPIMYGFIEGIRGLHDSMVESRSAALSLFLNKAPLALVEYFNREMQLVVAPLRNLHRGQDCRAKQLIAWTVQKDNLKNLHGLYYRLPGDSEQVALRPIRPNNVELIGKTVLLRTALTCEHPDEYGVCETCFGELGLSVPRQTNIAHVAVTELCARVSQKVLSNKHLVGSAIVSEFVIAGADKKYIRTLASGFQIATAASLDVRKTQIMISKEDASNVADVMTIENMNQVSPDRISQMSDVTFVVEDEDGGVSYEPVSVGMGSRKASFSIDFLIYLSRKRYDIDPQSGDLIINLDGWDPDLPIWVLPRKHASMLEFLGDVKDQVKVNGRNSDKEFLDLSNHDSLAQALAEFYDTVTSKFSLNLTHLAVILAATLVRSKADDDYRLPLPGGNREFARFSDNMTMRSLSAVAAHENQAAQYRDPKSYVIKDRPTHPFDAIILPESVGD